MSILKKIFDHSLVSPDRVAFYQKEGTKKFGEFYHDICLTSKKLNAAGVEKDDFVLVVATNDYEFICTYFAIHLLGAVVVSIAPDIDDEFKGVVAKQINPKITVENCADFAPQGDEVFEKTCPQELQSIPSEVIFTSGTTGKPKGVVLTHGQITAATKHIISHVKNKNTDIELLLMPLSHSFGMARMRSTLYAGGALVLGYEIKRLKSVFGAIEQHRVTGLALVPSAWQFITQMSKGSIKKYADQLNYIELGSAPLSVADKLCLTNWFPKTHIVMHYGSTEVSRALYTYLHIDDHQSIGNRSRGAQSAIVNETKEFIKNGEVGEIVLKAPWMFSEYFNDTPLTKECHIDGFLRTGDQGYIDGSSLFLTGRINEIINVGGKKFNPLRVENLINKCKYVKESACIGWHDDNTGEVVHAFVVLEPLAKVGLDRVTTVLKKIVASNFPVFMRPLKYTFVDTLPKTSTGKIKRFALKN